jgi:hypothetical protein
MFVTFVSTLFFHDFVEMLGSMLLISIFRDIGVNICTFCHKYNKLFFLYIVWLPIYTCLILLSSNLLTLRVPDDGYSIFTFLLLTNYQPGTRENQTPLNIVFAFLNWLSLLRFWFILNDIINIIRIIMVMLSFYKLLRMSTTFTRRLGPTLKI